MSGHRRRGADGTGSTQAMSRDELIARAERERRANTSASPWPPQGDPMDATGDIMAVGRPPAPSGGSGAHSDLGQWAAGNAPRHASDRPGPTTPDPLGRPAPDAFAAAPMTNDPMAADPMAAAPPGPATAASGPATAAPGPASGPGPGTGFDAWDLRNDGASGDSYLFGGPDEPGGDGPWHDEDEGDEGGNRKRILLTIGAAALVAIVGIGAVVFFTSGDGGEQANAQGGPENAQPFAGESEPPEDSDDQPKKKKPGDRNRKSGPARLAGVSLSQECSDEYNTGLEPVVIAKFRGQGTVVYQWFQNGFGQQSDKVQVSGTATVKQVMPQTSQAVLKVTSPKSVTKTIRLNPC